MDLKQTWHNLAPAKATAALESDLQHGLTAEQVRIRLEQLGPSGTFRG